MLETKDEEKFHVVTCNIFMLKKKKQDKKTDVFRASVQPNIYIFDSFKDKWEHYVSGCRSEAFDSKIIIINRDNWNSVFKKMSLKIMCWKIRT